MILSNKKICYSYFVDFLLNALGQSKKAIYEFTQLVFFFTVI